MRALWRAACCLKLTLLGLAGEARASENWLANPRWSAALAGGATSCVSLLWEQDPCPLAGVAYVRALHQTRHTWAQVELPYFGHSPHLRTVASGGLRVGPRGVRMLLGPSLEVSTVGGTFAAPGGSLILELRPEHWGAGEWFSHVFEEEVIRSGLRMQKWLSEADAPVYSSFYELLFRPRALGVGLRVELPALRPDDGAYPRYSTQSAGSGRDPSRAAVPVQSVSFLLEWLEPGQRQKQEE